MYCELFLYAFGIPNSAKTTEVNAVLMSAFNELLIWEKLSFRSICQVLVCEKVVPKRSTNIYKKKLVMASILKRLLLLGSTFL